MSPRQQLPSPVLRRSTLWRRPLLHQRARSASAASDGTDPHTATPPSPAAADRPPARASSLLSTAQGRCCPSTPAASCRETTARILQWPPIAPPAARDSIARTRGTRPTAGPSPRRTRGDGQPESARWPRWRRDRSDRRCRWSTTPRLEREPRRFRKLPHQLRLFLVELLGHRHRELHDQVAALAFLGDPLAAHAKAFPARRARGNLDRDRLLVERLDAHLGPERRLRDVHRRVHHKIESLARPVLIGLHLERDHDVTGWPTVQSAPTLPLQPDLRPRVHARRHRDVHLLAAALFTRSAARRAFCRRHRSLSEAHRARTVHGEPTLTERDRPAAAALGAALDLRARRCAAALARHTLLVQLELDRHLAAERRRAKRDVECSVDALTLLGAARPLGATGTAAEHGAEQVTEPAKTAHVEFVERAAARPAGRASRTGAARPSAAAAAARGSRGITVERAEAAHLIVLMTLLCVAQYLVRL